VTRPAPIRVRIFVYNVGFGDCILLCFDYDQGRSRTVLVDFGSTQKAQFGAPPSMNDVAREIGEQCGGKLDVVIATHRHADHISGFAGSSGAVISGLQPEVVVQPWTEEPGLAVDATDSAVSSPRAGNRKFTARLDRLHAAAAQVLHQIPRLAATPGVTASLTDELRFLGETNIKNAEAVKALQAMGDRHEYASFGSDLGLADVLPGVGVEVLGPPTLAQSPEIAAMAASDADEFWHLAATADAVPGQPSVRDLFPGARTARRVPQEARWLVPRIDKMQAEELLSLVRILDDVMNNTSLILLFTIGETLLLFPGDAQLENWSYALQRAPNSADICARLSQTRVYKVGHHGSLNSTPRTMLWGGFARAGQGDPAERLITLLSTRAGKHGSESRGTEVPRGRLVEELEARSELVNTQDCRAASGWWREVVVPL